MLEESEWSRTLALSKEFDNFNQKEAETNNNFVGRFNNLVTKLWNERVGKLETWSVQEQV